MSAGFSSFTSLFQSYPESNDLKFAKFIQKNSNLLIGYIIKKTENYRINYAPGSISHFTPYVYLGSQVNTQLKVAIDLLRLLHDFCNPDKHFKDFTDIEKEQKIIEILQFKITAKSCRSRALPKLADNFKRFIEENTDLAENEMQERDPASDINNVEVKKELENCFLEKILRLMMLETNQRSFSHDNSIIIKNLRNSGLLDLSDIGFRLRIVSFLSNSRSRYAFELSGLINDTRNHTASKNQILNIDHLKQARDILFQQINDQLFKKIKYLASTKKSRNDVIKANENINKLLDILRVYDDFICKLELNNEAENRNARKKDDGCGAGGAYRATGGSKGKGPAATIQTGEVIIKEMSPEDQKILQLAVANGIKPKNPSEFIYGVKNPEKIGLVTMQLLLEMDENEHSGAMLGLYLELHKAKVANKRLQDEQSKVVSHGEGSSSSVPMASEVDVANDVTAHWRQGDQRTTTDESNCMLM